MVGRVTLKDWGPLLVLLAVLVPYIYRRERLGDRLTSLHVLLFILVLDTAVFPAGGTSTGIFVLPINNHTTGILFLLIPLSSSCCAGSVAPPGCGSPSPAARGWCSSAWYFGGVHPRLPGRQRPPRGHPGGQDGRPARWDRAARGRCPRAGPHRAPRHSASRTVGGPDRRPPHRLLARGLHHARQLRAVPRCRHRRARCRRGLGVRLARPARPGGVACSTAAPPRRHDRVWCPHHRAGLHGSARLPARRPRRWPVPPPSGRSSAGTARCASPPRRRWRSC